MPIILASQEAELKRIMVQSQPRQIVHETLSRKTLHKNRAGGVAQGEGPEFKPKYCKKINNERSFFPSFLLGYSHCTGGFIVTIPNRITLCIG
jgi:hypothetical protein